jgi:hypothetical protein
VDVLAGLVRGDDDAQGRAVLAGCQWAGVAVVDDFGAVGDKGRAFWPIWKLEASSKA